MRPRDPSIAVASIILLLIILCLNAHAGDNDRSVVRRATPVYPELARQMHLTGSVILRISIAADGSVGEIKIQSGHPILAEAATEAVRKWRYAPAPQATQSTVCINFEPH